eukprot:1179465-Prorocentrum_minimum.AAC.25
MGPKRASVKVARSSCCETFVISDPERLASRAFAACSHGVSGSVYYTRDNLHIMSMLSKKLNLHFVSMSMTPAVSRNRLNASFLESVACKWNDPQYSSADVHTSPTLLRPHSDGSEFPVNIHNPVTNILTIFVLYIFSTGRGWVSSDH